MLGSPFDGPGLRRVAALDVDSFRTEAERGGMATFVLPAHGIVDTASLFDAVRTTLPLDPPLVGAHSWDALADSLWEGLFTHARRRMLILWPNARDLASHAPSDFKIALEVLTDIASTLADATATQGSPKELAVLVEANDDQTDVAFVFAVEDVLVRRPQ